jgi:hypothetical protein
MNEKVLLETLFNWEFVQITYNLSLFDTSAALSTGIMTDYVSFLKHNVSRYVT